MTTLSHWLDLAHPSLHATPKITLIPSQRSAHTEQSLDQKPHMNVHSQNKIRPLHVPWPNSDRSQLEPTKQIR
jgi:hypothetical protein